MTTLTFSTYDFSFAISNVHVQFVPVNKGLNAAYFMLQYVFRKYFCYAQMMSLKAFLDVSLLKSSIVGRLFWGFMSLSRSFKIRRVQID